ncbi:peptidoglycan-associated lipoprotein Pal [Tranquillimonas alkanivorans]|uniref:Peptidoglycan-associated lipoprotein n=1 Tax=Tranquillimonas alkanivorans TaxID=441119 RepID=A0A1I5N1Y3_9RHOB|nr:peptidoglycan-associated lipoprotein Pal [Tranquillimonas alkanivorans]SFP15707.1 peptidoglycan-associated lipoprotein [Tranquillimonas alkanivorans]
MTHLGKALMLTVALGLGACTSADRFGPGAGGAGAGAGGLYGPGAGGDISQSALDPASPAYFQETIGDRVLFLVDQSSLTGEAQATLAQQAQWLQRNPEYTAIIEGHADEQGTREYNLALGERRANAARDYLVSQGVSAGRLRTVSYGKERPIEICSDEACYRQNRRAVTVVASGLTS